MVVFVLLCLMVILLLLLTGETLWTLLMLILGILVFFWYLPRLIDLQQISGGDVPVAEGPVNGEELHLSLEYSDWHKREENKGEEEGSFYFYILVGALLVLLAAFLVFLLG